MHAFFSAAVRCVVGAGSHLFLKVADSIVVCVGEEMFDAWMG